MSEENNNSLKEFKDLFYPIKDQFEQLPIALLGLLKYCEELEEQVSTIKTQLKEKDDELTKIKDSSQEHTTTISNLQKENEEYKEKLENVEQSMAKFRQMYEDLSAEKEKDMDIEELIAIYSILFESVFAANPHTKILLLLHGIDKPSWTRNEITMTTGIAPASVLKALHDLRNNDIIEMDDETQEVKLVQKIV